MADAWRDALFGMRLFRRRPLLAASLTLTVGLGVGATTVIFGLVNAVLLRPLPYADAERLHLIWSAREGHNQIRVSSGDFADWRARGRAFDAMAAYTPISALVEREGIPTRSSAIAVTPDLFAMLGVRAIVGSTFTGTDAAPGAAPVVLLGESEWRSLYGADRGIVGRSIRVDGGSRTVIGVMPASLRLDQQQAAYWMPLAPSDDREGRGLVVLARLRPGVTLDVASREMAAITRDIARENPATNEGMGARIVSLHEHTVGDAREILRLFMVAAAIVLIAACANAANLMLGHVDQRAREMALRAALGASRGRLVWQILQESLWLGVTGGLVALLVATWVTGALAAVMPVGMLPRADELRVDPALVAFAAIGAFAAAFIAGLAPAVRVAHTELRATLAGDGAAPRFRARGIRGRSIVAALQVAAGIVLAVNAALLARSMRELLAVDMGFDPRGVYAIQLSGGRPLTTGAGRATFTARARAEASAVPGVTAAALIAPSPLSGIDATTGIRPAIDAEPQRVKQRAIAGPYFETMRVTLRRGRMFDARDRDGAERVAIVSESAARALWPGIDAIGRSFLEDSRRPGVAPTEWRVVGVVNDVHHGGPRLATQPEIYRPFEQETPFLFADVVVRTADAVPPGAELRRALASVAPGLPVGVMESLAVAYQESMAETRFQGWLIGAFASLVVLLAMVGVYGVISQAVADRTFEIGVRMALGARGIDVARLVARSVTAIAIAGMVMGLAGVVIVERTLRSALFGVASLDPAILAMATAGVLAVTLAACVVPARRAVAVDPLIALRG